MTEYSLDDFKDRLREKTLNDAVAILEIEFKHLDRLNLKLPRNDENSNFHCYRDHLNTLYKIFYQSHERPKNFKECLNRFEDILRPLIEQGLIRNVYRLKSKNSPDL